MIRKKICMLGASGVGKTSLTRRFVDSIFSDDYLSTVGVKIDHKQLSVDGSDLGLVIWDVQGQDDSRTISPSFLKGASGYCLIVDLTMPDSVRVAADVRDAVVASVGDLPFVIAANKSDLVADGTELDLGSLAGEAVAVVTSSAKTGQGVETMFSTLGRVLVGSAGAGGV